MSAHYTCLVTRHCATYVFTRHHLWVCSVHRTYPSSPLQNLFPWILEHQASVPEFRLPYLLSFAG